MPGSKTTPFAIGADEHPGLAKLAEECGETVQIIGKLIAFPGGDHPDKQGDLHSRLTLECGDLYGILCYVMRKCESIDNEVMIARAQEKYERFLRWHAEEQEG